MGSKIQRINHVSTEPEEENDLKYEEDVVLNLEEETDGINFLEENPSYPSFKGSWRQLKILIDTGASKNYIKPIKALKGIMSIGNLSSYIRFMVITKLHKNA